MYMISADIEGSGDFDCLEMVLRSFLMLPLLKQVPSRWEHNHCVVIRLLESAGCDSAFVVGRTFSWPSFRNLLRFQWVFPEQLDGNRMKAFDELAAFFRGQMLEVNELAPNELTRVMIKCIRHERYAFHPQSTDAKTRGRKVVYYIDLLCRFGANLKYDINDGLGILHVLFSESWSAVGSDHVKQLARILIHHGADVWARVRNDHGRTPTLVVGCSVTDLVAAQDADDNTLTNYRGHMEDWFDVLRGCGLDLDTFLAKEWTFKRTWESLQNAERSGFDTEIVIGERSTPRHRRPYNSQVGE